MLENPKRYSGGGGIQPLGGDSKSQVLVSSPRREEDGMVRHAEHARSVETMASRAVVGLGNIEETDALPQSTAKGAPMRE